MNTKHKLTLKSWYSWEEITIEFNSDSTVDDIKTIFRTIMVFLTYHPDQKWLDRYD